MLKFYCPICNNSYKSDKIVYYCECGNPLVLKTKYKIKKKIFNGKNLSHAKYQTYLPFKIISIGEGGTPLIKSEKFNVYFKLEFLNPTGSFKDRGSSMEIGYAYENSIRNIATASTGNMAASLSAYSSIINANIEVFLTKGIPLKKLNQIKVYGGNIFKKKFNSYKEALRYCENYSKRKNYFIAGDYSIRLEAQKTIAYEIFEQLGKVPDLIILPVGNGTLFCSLYKGFREIGRLPKIIGIQAKGCNAIERALSRKKERIFEIKKAKTKASSIACEYPLWGNFILKLCYENDFEVRSVSDSDMIKSKLILAKNGFLVELGSAAPFSFFLNFRDKLKNYENIVIILTGSGLKE